MKAPAFPATRTTLPRGTVPLIISDFINTVGTGIFVTGGTLYLHQAEKLTIAQISMALAVGGIVGLVSAPFTGQLADHAGPREISMTILGIRALAVIGLVFEHAFPLIMISITISLICQNGIQGSFGALTASVGGAEKLRVQAFLRAGTNCGVAVGTAASAPALAVGTPAAYRLLIVADALMLALASGTMHWVERVPPTSHKSGIGTALSDRPYLVVTGLQGLLGFQYSVLSFALPLWVITRTDAPRWAISACIALNTVLVAGFQVRATRGASSTAAAARQGRRAGAIFLLSCALLGAVTHLSDPLTLAVLLVGMVVHSVGELLQASSSFAMSFNLARDGAYGQYQGVFALGQGSATALGPALLGLLCLRWGPAGWLALGCGLALAGQFLPAAGRWATDRSRPRPAVLHQ